MTKSYVRWALLAGLTTVLAGCADQSGNAQLIFGQAHTFGVKIGGTASDQGGDLIVGYKDADIAIVPVMSKDGKPLSGHSVNGSNNSDDALSVFGEFNGGASKADGVSLGTFFATGQAAHQLATGYKYKIAETKIPN